MNKHNTLVQGNSGRVQISQTKSEIDNHHRTRIKRPPQRFTGGRGRGRGRGGLRPRRAIVMQWLEILGATLNLRLGYTVERNILT